MASENKTLKRGIELYIDGKQVQANMKQVEAEARKLKKEIDGMTVGSKEYFEATKRYQELNRVLREHKNELKGIETQQQSLLSKGVQLFKDYSLQITGAVAALTGISMKINAFRKQAAEKEDAAANLKALTTSSGSPSRQKSSVPPWRPQGSVYASRPPRYWRRTCWWAVPSRNC